MTTTMTNRARQMGRFSVEVELTNEDDVTLAKRGHISSEEVRHVRLRGVVDSGAIRLVIPARVATQLGWTWAVASRFVMWTAELPTVRLRRIFGWHTGT